jgi:hypothetical protein
MNSSTTETTNGGWERSRCCYQNMVKPHLNSKCSGTFSRCDALCGNIVLVSWRWSWPCARHKVIEEKQSYSSFITLALGGSEWPASLFGHFIPEESAPVSTEQEAGWGPVSECTLSEKRKMSCLCWELADHPALSSVTVNVTNWKHRCMGESTLHVVRPTHVFCLKHISWFFLKLLAVLIAGTEFLQSIQFTHTHIGTHIHTHSACS